MPFSSSALRASLILCTLVLAATVQAQAPTSARLEKARGELQKRFEAADANKDGKLTREEAQAKMPRIHKNYDAIDASRSGAISLTDIETFMVSKRGSR